MALPTWPELPQKIESCERQFNLPNGMGEDSIWRKNSAEVRAIKGTIAVHKSTPFSTEVLDDVLLVNLRLLQIGEYDGFTDLEDHLCRFEHVALLH